MSEESPSYTILVVEDDPNHQMLIKRALTVEGSPFAVVQIARDSDDAERFVKQMGFDCLLVDNRIPGRRGLDLIDSLREQGVESPFVLMTSVGTEDLVVQAYRKRVADYVIKETGFWKDLPHILMRVIREDQARKREVELRERLQRTNEKLDRLNTDIRLQNEEMMATRRELEDKDKELARMSEELDALREKLASLESGE